MELTQAILPSIWKTTQEKKKKNRTQKKREKTIALHRDSIIAIEVYLRYNYCSLEILPGNRCSKETHTGDSGTREVEAGRTGKLDPVSNKQNEIKQQKPIKEIVI